MNKHAVKKKRGFGLIEVLVASTTVSLILSALIIAGNTVLKNSVRLGQRVQAMYLAQEGIEIIRQMRDTNWIDNKNTTDWNTWIWDSSDSSLIKPEEGGECYLKYVSNRFGLKCDDGKEEMDLNHTLFTRSFKIEGVGELLSESSEEDILNQTYNSLKVTVRVSWGSGQNEAIETSEILTNWRPQY